MDERDVRDVEALSPTEQKIYSRTYSKRVVATEDVRDVVGRGHKCADYINNLREKGYFQKIRKGLYAVVPPNLVNTDEMRPDKFIVASKIRNQYYISHHSALELQGLAQSVFSVVWITSKNPGRSFSFQDIDYRIITTKHFFGYEAMDYLGVPIKVSDTERTVLDCIRNHKYAGGWEELMKSLENLPYLDLEKIMDYLGRFNEKSLYQKAGFVLQSLDIEMSRYVLMRSKEKIGKRTYYLDKNKDSFYLKEWNLMIPKRFKEWVTVA